MEKLKLSLQEIAEITGEDEKTISKAIERGHLNTFIVGRRRFAKPEAVRSWVDFLEAESNAGRPVIYRARSEERCAIALV